MMWATLYQATTRTLKPSELQDLDRLCHTLRGALPIPGKDQFSKAAEGFCSSLHNSAVFKSGGIPSIETLLEQIDILKELLDGDASTDSRDAAGRITRTDAPKAEDSLGSED